MQLPQIGDVVISANDKFKNEDGSDLYDLLDCDGESIDEVIYSKLSNVLPVGEILQSSSFTVISETSTPYGITFDGTYLWVVGNAPDDVHKYNLDGTYTGESFYVGAEDTIPYGICWDGEFFWVVGGATHVIYKYTSVGVYTGFSIDLSGLGAYGIAFDGEYLWIGTYDTNIIYKYTTAGVYTGISFDVSENISQLRGIAFDGEFIWAIDQSNRYIFKYGLDGLYKNESHYSTYGTTGLEYLNNSLWVGSSTSIAVYQLTIPKLLPNLTAKDPRVPYKMVADLT